MFTFSSKPADYSVQFINMLAEDIRIGPPAFVWAECVPDEPEEKCRCDQQDGGGVTVVGSSASGRTVNSTTAYAPGTTIRNSSRIPSCSSENG